MMYSMMCLTVCVKRILVLLCIVVAIACLGFNISYRNMSTERLISHSNIFRETISPHERELYKSLLVIFGDAAQKLNMTYFLADGSLIGSVRHHGMIPWDDDLDVGVLRSEEDKMHKMHDILPENVQLLRTGSDGRCASRGVLG